MLACLIVGVVRLASTYYANKQSSYAYLASAFALSCGLGLLLAYFGVLGFRRTLLKSGTCAVVIMAAPVIVSRRSPRQRRSFGRTDPEDA
jgi:hypothetical protein